MTLLRAVRLYIQEAQPCRTLSPARPGGFSAQSPSSMGQTSPAQGPGPVDRRPPMMQPRWAGHGRGLPRIVRACTTVLAVPVRRRGNAGQAGAAAPHSTTHDPRPTVPGAGVMAGSKRAARHLPL